MSERWYKEAVIYCVQVDLFADSDGDGCGDLSGLIGRLDYLSRLGVTCLWLNPIHPSPRRDDGYDVTDYYGVDPRIGDLGDFVELTLQARERGMRIIIRSGCQSHLRPASVVPGGPIQPRTRLTATGMSGASEEPPDRRQGIVFPGEQTETWSFDDDGAGVVLPPLLRLPTGPELVQPRRPGRDQEDHGLLAADGCIRLPRRRRTLCARTGFRGARSRPDSTSPSSTTGARMCSGATATRSCSARPTCPPTISRTTPAPPSRGRTTEHTCSSPSS